VIERPGLKVLHEASHGGLGQGLLADGGFWGQGFGDRGTPGRRFPPGGVATSRDEVGV